MSQKAPAKRRAKAGATRPSWRSVSFTGEWPRGVHWAPGEVRALPDGFPVPTGAPPPGLEPVTEKPAEEV